MDIMNLTLTWSISRGRDTYGYNICRLDDPQTGKRYRCNGGGYDMTGTVFGMWLMDVHQDRLSALAWSFYGLRRYNDGHVNLDGACGINSMVRVAEALGLEVQTQYDKKGRTTGWLVIDEKAPHAS